MKKAIILVFFLFLFTYSFGQIVPQWVSNYGGNPNFSYTVSDMVTDKAGNVFECGFQSDSSYILGVVIKYNSAGVQQWVDTSTLIRPNSKITIDRMENVYVISSVYGFSFSSDYLTRKYNSSGIVQWTSIYNGSANKTDHPNAIVVDDSLNVYVTGEACESFGYIRAYSTVKYNSLGIQQWVAKTGSGEDDRSNAVTVDSLQNVYVTGQSIDTLNGCFLTVKYNKYGIEQWQRRYGGSIYSLGLFIDVSEDGFIYVGGVDFDYENMDYLAIKYDSFGNEMWTATYDAQASLGYGAYDVPSDMDVDIFGSVYLTGTQFQGNGTSDDFCTTKFDKNGNLKWARSYNGLAGWDDAKGIQVDDEGNVYVSGQSDDNFINTQILVTIRYDSTGSIVWLAKYESPINENYYSTEIGLDSLNNVYVSGSSMSNTSPVFITLKYDRTTVVESLTTTDAEIRIYPNPATSIIIIEFDLIETKNTSVEIKNVLGQTVKTVANNSLSKGNNKLEIGVSEFLTGIYFVQMKHDTEIISKKFIKQ